jgi:hypothetical protein
MAVLDLQIGMFGQKLADLGFNRLGQQGTRTIAQDLGQLVSEVYRGPVLRHPTGLIQAANCSSGILDLTT